MPPCVKLCAALLVAATAWAAPCEKPVARQPAGNYLLPGVLGDVVYRDGLALDAYAPPGEPRPAAVVIHGSRGNKITHVTQLFELLARAGYAWFAVNYRDVSDVEAAVGFIRCPGRFNLTDKIVLIGEDTGAEIAMELAAREPRAPRSGLPHVHANLAGVVAFGAKLEADTPMPDIPVLMIHGTDDREAPPAELEALCKKLSQCSFYPVSGAIHNFENWHPDQWHWKEKLAEWLWEDRRGLLKDIVYARREGHELLLDAFIPAGRGPFPVVVIVHGGGWEAGDKVTYVAPIFEPLARAGFAWFSINYRLTPYVHNPDQLDDLRAAIRFIRHNAARFHLDGRRMALLGESASGQMVAQVASEPCSGCEVQAVVSFYGVYDFTAWPEDSSRRAQLDRLFGNWTAETLRRYSPLCSAHGSIPPVLIIQGTEDRLYAQALAYDAKLAAVGATHELLLLKGAPHGMENWEGHPDWVGYKQKLVGWLRATLH